MAVDASLVKILLAQETHEKIYTYWYKNSLSVTTINQLCECAFYIQTIIIILMSRYLNIIFVSEIQNMSFCLDVVTAKYNSLLKRCSCGPSSSTKKREKKSFMFLSV